MWQLLTSFGAVSGLAVTTMAITYLLPVVTAVTDRRTQANTIAGLGATPQDIGIPTVDDATFVVRLDAARDHRRRLAAFAAESLWHPQV